MVMMMKRSIVAIDSITIMAAAGLVFSLWSVSVAIYLLGLLYYYR